MYLGLAKTPESWESAQDDERHSHISDLFDNFLEYINCWTGHNYVIGNCTVDYSIFKDIVRHYYHDLNRLSANMRDGDELPVPNEYKQYAIFSFWIRKLKPITLDGLIEHVNNDFICWINEIIAIHIAITELDVTCNTCVSEVIPDELSRDLLVFFRYKSVSPHALYLVFASMYSVRPPSLNP